MKPRTALVAVAAASLGAAGLAAACATPGEPRSSRSRDVIEHEELVEVPRGSLYEALRALRPRWLQARSSGTFRDTERETPRVYLDGQPFGRIGDLRSLMPGDVDQVRFLSASDATIRFGTNHLAGAIVVTTRRR